MDLLNVGTGKPYSLIQSAINACPNGGSVQVNAGGVTNVYAEALVVNNKRIRLYGAIDGPGISVTGAGGASPALLVSGTGGCFAENLKFSCPGSSAAYVVQLNNNQDWLSRCVIDGGGTAYCLLGQYGDNLLLANGTRGCDPSCAGVLLFQHCTVVNMSIRGFYSAYASEYIGCLGYNCNGQAFINPSAGTSFWLFADDATPAPVPGALPYLTLGQIDFVNYAGGDFRLKQSSKAFLPGISTLAIDGTGQARVRSGDNCRVYGGYHDPAGYGGASALLAWLTGSASIRKY